MSSTGFRVVQADLKLQEMSGQRNKYQFEHRGTFQRRAILIADICAASPCDAPLRR